LGLGSCWAQIRDRQHDNESTAESYIQSLLGLPEHIKVECVLGIGHPAEEKLPVPDDKLQRDKIKYNQWN
jgi:nitroreductase